MLKHSGKFAWLVLSIAIVSCTVAPKPVVPRQIAWDGSVQNAGIIDCDKTGCLVTSGWIGKYRKMEKEFENYFDMQITPEGSNFRVSYETLNHYAIMRAAERG